jgi:hypothetical protein
VSSRYWRSALAANVSPAMQLQELWTVLERRARHSQVVPKFCPTNPQGLASCTPQVHRFTVGPVNHTDGIWLT